MLYPEESSQLAIRWGVERITSTLRKSVIALALILTAGLSFISVGVPSVKGIASVYLFPSFISAEPGTTFKVDLRISGGRDVFGWQATIGWNSSVLDFVNATEGRFLKGIEDNPTQWFNVTYQDQVGNDTIALGCTRLGYVLGVDGSGVAATIAFRVQIKGETPLYLTNTILADSRPTPFPIQHTTTDGLFSNIVPVPTAAFSFTPLMPQIGEAVTFDGSASYDLNRTIAGYFWDFGDGSNYSAVDPAASHAYSEGGTYDVALTVTNDLNFSNTLIRELRVRFTFDVAITDVTLSDLSVTTGDKVTITVIAANEGSETASFDVNVFYSSTEVGSLEAAPATRVNNLAMGQNSTLTFEWDTAGVEAGDYKMRAVAETLSGETFTDNNSKFGSEISVKAPAPFPWTMIIGIVAIVAVAGLGVFFFMRRRGKGKAPAPPI